MATNSQISSQPSGLENSGEVLSLSNRRTTAWVLRLVLWGGVIFFSYQIANQLAFSRNAAQQAPVAALLFLSVSLALASYVAMRQRADLLARNDPRNAAPAATLHPREDAETVPASIADSSEDATVRSTPDGLIVSWNSAAERLFGYRADEMVGKALSVLSPPDRASETAGLLDRANRGETVSQLETVTADSQGRPVDISLTVSPVRDSNGTVVGASLSARDMRGRVREALEPSEERYRTLIANLPDVVWMADEAGEPAFVSSNCKTITGFTREEICRPGFWTGRIHAEDLSRVQAAWHALFQQGQPIDTEYRFQRRDGEWIWLQSRATKTYSHNGKQYRDGLVSDVTARKEMEQKLAHQADHDLLTGLPNRAVFEDRLSQTLARARRNGGMAALLYLDLDRFKRINDTLGYLAGDSLIQMAAQRLTGCLRDSETLSRSGGDRFMLALGDVQNGEDAAKVAARIQECLEAPFSIKGNELFLSASIGIALFPHDGMEVPSLQRAADHALHAAKRQGQRRVQMSTPELGRAAGRRLAIETELHYALERDELAVHYQPQYDLATNRIAGVEALVRWRNPKFGQVPPSVLIPIAEESGLIVAIGARVLKEACRQGKAWQDAGYGPLPVAVNTSAVQFTRGGLAQLVADTLAETGLEARWLDLEVTESVIMQDMQESVRQLKQLKQLGVSVSLDDFGTGYSSLSYLEELPIDNLKIDRKFVQRMNGAESTSTLVQSIVGLAHSLGMRAVAEGVETTEQLDQLKAMGCDRAQSFMLGGPAPAERIGWLLSRAR